MAEFLANIDNFQVKVFSQMSNLNEKCLINFMKKH